eukprot:TRINITY_DN356_c0_g2_i1.p1 TRINITY_DN356_c0_g2~~TRINITY_DN356_c0_g2_i1.p1  ORF type:complete len:111 (+),score=40.34 TRINITY_DN356_c0_g2_i1:313-645(+)
MRHIAAYFLAVLGGNANPDAAAIKSILDAAGASVDDAQLEKVISELKGKNLWEVVEAGQGKLASVPSGGGGGGGGAAAPAAAAAAEAPAEEAPKEEEEESDDDMGFGLFD